MPSAIELSSRTAVWDESRVTVYETTQGVSMIQFNLCNMLDLDPENVRVISRFIGGALGVARDGREHAIRLLDDLSPSQRPRWTLVDTVRTPKAAAAACVDSGDTG